MMILAYILTVLWILVLIRVVTLTGISIHWIARAVIDAALFLSGALWFPVAAFLDPSTICKDYFHPKGFEAGLDTARGIWAFGLLIAHVWLIVTVIDWLASK
jgi:hypothetical protein